MAGSYSFFQQLPDSVLFHVFSFLDGTSLSRASCVCEQWNRVALDEVLWRDLVFGIIRKHAPLPQGKDSWRGEYQHLTHHAPTELSQEVAGHTDEVYFLNFSPSGKYLASVGRDGTCRLWNYNYKITLQSTAGPFFDPPPKTRFCEFNESETMLMVTGLTHYFDMDGNMFVAVLSVPDLCLLSAIKGEYPNFRGAWLNNTQFLIDSFFYNQGNSFLLDAHEVKLSSKKKWSKIEELFIKCRTEGRTVLETSRSSKSDFIRVVDPRKWGDLSQYYDCTEKWDWDRDVGPCSSGYDVSERDGGDQADSGVRKTDTDLCDIEMDCDEFDDDAEDSKLKPEGNQHSDEDLNDDEDFWEDEEDLDQLYASDAGDFNPNDYSVYNKLIGRAKLMAKQRQPEAKNNQTKNEVDEKSYSDTIREIQASGSKIVIMVHSYNHDSEKCLIALYAVKDGDFGVKKFTKNVTKPFKTLKMDAGIVGLRISPDHRYLVFCSRAVADSNRSDEVFEREILTIVYDLILDQCVRTVYVGSSATSPSHLSYIFPDISKDFVATGDEEMEGHLWDRHYGIAIQSNIAHLDCGERACGLNAVVFHPHDQETLVTAGDDKLLKVWRSKYRLVEMSRPSNTTSKYKEIRHNTEAHQFRDLHKENDEAHQSHDFYEGDTDNDKNTKSHPQRRHKLCFCVKKQDSK